MEYGHDCCLYRLTGYFNFIVTNIDINLGPDAEKIRLIYARLNRETGGRDNTAGIGRLKIINVRAVAVHLFANRMTCAGRKLLAVSCSPYAPARDTVNFSAAYG